MNILESKEASANRDANFDKWWDTYGEWFESGDQLVSGESGIQRLHAADGRLLYSKRQVNHLSRSALHPFGRPTILDELQALEALKRLGVRVPEVVFSDARKVNGEWQALLVTEALEGFNSLEDWYLKGGPQSGDEALNQQMLRQLANTVGLMHVGGWEHGRLSPKTIFVKVRMQGDEAVPEIALLGLAKARHHMSTHQASSHDFDYFKAHHQPMPESDWVQFAHAYRGVLESDYIR